MDQKDKKILYELDKNSRLSLSKIGKSMGMAPLTVRYRVNKMVERGVIQKFVTIINATKLGYSFYKLQLKLQNVDDKKRHKIIEFLKKDSRVSWIASFEGPYDLAFITLVKNQLELQELLDSLHKKFSSFIMKKNISINLTGEFFPRDYLIGAKRKIIQESLYEPHEKIEVIDNLDRGICKMLAENSRAQIIDIAEKLNSSSDTIIKRIKVLKEKNIISGFTVALKNETMEQFHYKLLVYLNDVSDEKVSKFLEFAKKNNRVFAVIKVLADWDYELDLEVNSARELQEFTMQLSNKFSGIIKDHETLQVLEMPKYFYFP